MNKLLKNIILHCPARTCPAKFPEICPINFPFPCPNIEPIENNIITITSIAKKCISCNKNHKNKTHKNIIKT
jgi:hypothetical protein